MTTAATKTPNQPIDIPPSELKSMLDAGQCVLVDVREDAEYREERIAGSQSMPLSKFDAEKLRAEHAGKQLIFHCKGGKRSAKACSLFGTDGQATHHLAGGIDAWKSAGLPTIKPEGGPPIPIMRQVLLTAGLLVLIGVGLGFLVHPVFFGLAGFVGAGLTFSGATGYCGMAMLLGKMPWNR